MKTRIESRPKQPTPKELTDELLGFLRRKFYAGDDRGFFQERARLLSMVVLWPASWLNQRGVSITTERYRQVFMTVFMDAIIHGSDRIKYRPAWMARVIQSHFAMHGEEIYNAAKSARSLVENALLLTGRPAATAPDPMREMAAARDLVKVTKRGKKPPVNDQLTLL